MIRLVPPGALVLLAACVQTGPSVSPVGTVEYNRTTYALEALPDGTWRTKVDGAVVLCARPTKEACLWSVRHHLTAQELLDDLG